MSPKSPDVPDHHEKERFMGGSYEPALGFQYHRRSDDMIARAKTRLSNPKPDPVPDKNANVEPRSPAAGRTDKAATPVKPKDTIDLPVDESLELVTCRRANDGRRRLPAHAILRNCLAEAHKVDTGSMPAFKAKSGHNGSTAKFRKFPPSHLRHDPVRQVPEIDPQSHPEAGLYVNSKWNGGESDEAGSQGNSDEPKGGAP